MCGLREEAAGLESIYERSGDGGEPGTCQREQGWRFVNRALGWWGAGDLSGRGAHPCLHQAHPLAGSLCRSWFFLRIPGSFLEGR